MKCFALIRVVSVLILSSIRCASGNDSDSDTILSKGECKVVKDLCPDLTSDKHDILTLECLVSLKSNALRKLNAPCQNIVWRRINEMMDNEFVRKSLRSVCTKERFDCAADNLPGSYLKCVVNSKDDVKTGKDCYDMILRLENVAFNDYQFIPNFLKDCDGDVARFQCGRLAGRSETEMWNQFETIACLENRFANVSSRCRNEILKLAEAQSDDIKFDVQLYTACYEDQLRHCRNVKSAQVFDCLVQHRLDSLTAACQAHLTRRQKLVSQDYRISKGMMRACKDDIKKSHCRRQTSDDKSIRLAQVLVCLENVAKNGTSLDADCVAEMRDHRRILMEDYRLSPEIVSGCSRDIHEHCTELEVGGKTIHCLMALAQSRIYNRKLTATCQRALELLIKETDAGEDWRVDPLLQEACKSVVEVACKGIRGGDARVMSCLMDNVGTDHMPDNCENALMQIQYFVSRDYKLDPQLFRACRDDADRLCHATKSWNEIDSYAADNGPLVLPCLYRHAYHPEEHMKLNRNCLDQIRRVMRQRAVSVHLNPEIEETCMNDLVTYCSTRTKYGEEMQCLQDYLEKLEDKCRETIATYTEIEAENVDLNPYVSAHCREIIKELCASELRDERGDVMDCLVQHKNHALVKSKPKCRVSIEHFQLISIKDYRFTFKFKLACKPYAVRFCRNAKTKAAVVECLSEKVANDTIAEVKSDVQKDCRQQLKAQLFQQRESIDFDPKLAKACEADIKLYCKDIEHASAQVLECLQMVPKLTEPCHNEIFKVKKQETADNSVDYALMNMCADAIDRYCSKVDKSKVLICLRNHKDENNFNKKCKQVINHRIIEQNSDYRLNPSLQENCKMDIQKFCKDVIAKARPDKEMNGEVIKCLKSAFKLTKLTNRCEKEMAGILREQAIDLHLNPLLRVVCKNELDTICAYDEAEDSSKVEQCLKDAFLQKRIPTRECQEEVATMMQVFQADIQVDPLLQQACALDLLKFCSDIQQGNGRHIKCLKVMMDKEELSSECDKMLKERMEMLRNTLEVLPPANMQQLYSQVIGSPVRHYLIVTMISILGAIFVIGIFCGRRSRKYVLLKNK